MKKLKHADKTLLVISLFLALFGIIMIFSASSYTSVLLYKKSEYYFALKQTIILIGSLFISLIVLHVPLKKYNSLSKIILIGVFILLFTLKTYGSISNSARSWFKIFGFSLQPSEFAKTAIILYLACYYGAKKKFDNIYDTFIPIVPCVIIFGMVFIEPDRGTAIIIALITMFIFFTLPFDKDKYLKITRTLIILICGVGFAFVYFNQDLFSNGEAESRLHFRNPCSRYLEDTGYQVCNGYIAINNGGLFGVGLGKSTQKYLYLPEAHTDFIFAIVVEELGVITGGIILLLYLILLYRILYIARNAYDLRGSIIAFGTFAYILIHLVVNLGGLLALIPLTGVPLPFLSYGGSFFINLFILLSLTQRVAIETRDKRSSTNG